MPRAPAVSSPQLPATTPQAPQTPSSPGCAASSSPHIRHADECPRPSNAAAVMTNGGRSSRCPLNRRAAVRLTTGHGRSTKRRRADFPSSLRQPFYHSGQCPTHRRPGAARHRSPNSMLDPIPSARAAPDVRRQASRPAAVADPQSPCSSHADPIPADQRTLARSAAPAAGTRTSHIQRSQHDRRNGLLNSLGELTWPVIRDDRRAARGHRREDRFFGERLALERATAVWIEPSSVRRRPAAALSSGVSATSSGNPATRPSSSSAAATSTTLDRLPWATQTTPALRLKSRHVFLFAR